MPEAGSCPPHAFVVGVDGSGPATQALRWAMAAAERAGAAVHAVAVQEPDPLWLSPTVAFPAQDRRAIRDPDAIQALVQSCRTATPSDPASPPASTVPVTDSVLSGDPATELVKASADAHLLVLGRPNRRPLTRALLGGVAAGCIRHAQCAVVLIPGTT